MTYPLVPFTAGSKDSAAVLNAAFNVDRYAFCPTDQSVLNSAVLVNSTYLTLSVAANSTYLFDTLLMFDANTTADFQWNWSLPASSFMRQAFWTSSTAAATADATIFHQAADSVGPATSGGVAAGTYMTLIPCGIIITAGSGGTAVLQFAQAVANNTNATVLKGGSWIHLRKVA
jgi:hypothetical protein